MEDQLRIFNQESLQDTHNAISSQESADGQSLYNSQDGQMMKEYGQAPARVSLTQLPDDKKLRQMKDICGQNGSGSLESVNLQQSLESKLKTLLPTGGLTMFIKGWKQKATPSGRLYCQLVPSARPPGEIDYGLWATPLSQQANGTPEAFLERKRKSVSKGNSMGITLSDLNMQVQAYCLWATPAARDYKDTGNLETSAIRQDGKLRNDTVPRQAGMIQPGQSAPTGSKGSYQLNPLFSLWLMGFSKDVGYSIQRAMLSFRK